MKKMFQIIIALAAIMCLMLSQLTFVSAEAADDLTVQVEGGLISGAIDENGVKSYKGIPYAASAAGENRFRDPQPVEAWEGVRECTEFSAIAVQNLQTDTFGKWTVEYSDVDKSLENGKMSEDCLTLNVWTKAKEGDSLPVIVYIHGGANTNGSSSIEVYTGEHLAQKGVVYVSINYRLGIFGGLTYKDATGDEATGNFGLKDQIAALKWVQNNIVKFGGNPENVTIMGQSAGSANVQTLMLSPEAKGLFEHAFCLSANTYGTEYKTLEDAEAAVAESLSAYTLADLRSMTAEEILNLQSIVSYSYNVNDGKYLVTGSREAYASGEYNQCDFIMGCTMDDTDRVIGYEDASLIPETFEAAIQAVFGDKAEEFLAVYPVTGDNQKEIIDAANAALSAISCYRTAVAKQQGDSTHNNFVYYYDHILPDTEDRMLLYGAFHTSDVGYWMNHFTVNYPRNWTEADYLLGDMMSDYLVSFATTGNVNTEGRAEWKTIADTNGLSYMRLNENAAFVEMTEEQSAFWLSLESYNSVTLESLAATSTADVPDGMVKVQEHEVTEGAFIGEKVTVYENALGTEFYLTFDMFGDTQKISGTIEDGTFTVTQNRTGYFTDDVPEMLADMDETAWKVAQVPDAGVPEQMVKMQYHEVSEGAFIGTTVHVYENADGTEFYLTFDMFGDTQKISGTIEDGTVTVTQNRTGYFTDDVPDMMTDLDETAWLGI